MRSAILLTAALAAGACATELDKRVYVTDWTTVVITKTVTEALAPAPTEAPVQADQESTLTKKTTVVPDVTTDTPKANNAQAGSGSGGLLGALFGGGNSGKNSGANPDITKDEKPAHHAHHHKHKPAPAPTTTEVAPAPEPTTITETAAAPTTMSTTTTTADTPAPTTNSYQSDVLYNHNIHRSNHSAPSVSWDNELEQTAHTLAARCVYQHDTSIGGFAYGQNIGYGVTADQVGQMITNLMYNDEMEYFAELYGEANPSMANFDSWGHFSQIVWKDTTKVGCSTVMCKSLGNVDSSDALPFTVCNYSPPGNYAGQYNKNVLRPVGNRMFVAE
ncbi:SCP-like extracellular protein [Penicillium lagena]|uniref:SCP-like extracellular protein n=1 Tax=Penicillium lagena TaxID=94218 RepID=UPI00253F7A92|nr:SCP-like extracellular protein [Penicillium lagena]KAJ5620069.1 SCP-like extracellular protein [Penicillium lagena]